MIGKTISHYKIIEKLGSGSMGTVFKAEDTKLKRIVALKFLPPHLITGKTEKHRFLHEAQAASALNHPNIITIFDIVEELDKVFIVMEYCDGVMLTEKLKDGPLKQKELLNIAIGVAEGLNAAHKADITHRDIKSQNIIISEDCPPKIIDFGIAKQVGMTDITKDGTTLGTQCYMSPEQLHGSKVDKRSDIFSFGVVLYEMATGKLPFTGKHDAEILYSVVNEEPIPITTLNPNMDAELQRIVDKALKKDVKDRYQHIDDMLADLRNLKNRKQPKKHLKKSSWWRIPSYIAGVIIIVTIIYSLFLKKDDLTIEHNLGKKSIAVLPFTTIDRTEESEIFGEGIHDDILTQIAKIHDLKVIARTSVIKYKDTDKGIKDIAKELDVMSILEGSVRRVGDKIRIVAQLIDPKTEEHIWAETYDRTYADIFTIQSEVAKNIALSLKATLSPNELQEIDEIPTDNLEAYENYLQGKILLRTDIKSAINYFKKAIELDPKFADAYAMLSRVQLRIEWYKYNITNEVLEKAKTALDIAVELNPKSIEVKKAEGYYYYHGLLNYDKAQKIFNSVLQSRPNDSELLEALGWININQGNYDEALKLLINAFRLDPRSTSTAYGVSLAAYFMHNYKLSEQYSDLIILIDPNYTGAYSLKIKSAINIGDIDKARIIMTEALDRIQPYNLLRERAEIEYFSGNYSEALNIRKEYINDGTIFDMQNLFFMGSYAFFSGKQALAKSYFESLIHLCDEGIRHFNERKIISNQDEWIPHAFKTFAYAYLGIKDKAIAEADITSTLNPISREAINGAVWAYDLINIYIQIGEYDRAIEQTDYVLSIPSGLTVERIKLDPLYDPIRDDSRFQELIKKYGE